MFASTFAPLILCFCAIAFFILGIAFRRGGRPGKAMFDFICGASLLIVAYYLVTEFHCSDEERRPFPAFLFYVPHFFLVLRAKMLYYSCFEESIQPDHP